MAARRATQMDTAEVRAQCRWLAAPAAAHSPSAQYLCHPTLPRCCPLVAGKGSGGPPAHTRGAGGCRAALGCRVGGAGALLCTFWLALLWWSRATCRGRSWGAERDGAATHTAHEPPDLPCAACTLPMSQRHCWAEAAWSIRFLVCMPRHIHPATQGGRWLESSTVEHEGARGYGALHHHPQQSTPEVLNSACCSAPAAALLPLWRWALPVRWQSCHPSTPTPSICKRAGAGCPGWAEVSGVCSSR